MGPLIALFWTSGDVLSGFQSQSGRSVCDVGYLRFTSGVTPANLLAASIAAELISSTYLQAGIGGARTLYRLDETFFNVWLQ